MNIAVMPFAECAPLLLTPDMNPPRFETCRARYMSRVSDRITISPGVRYTLNFPSTEEHNQSAVFNLATRQLDYLGRDSNPRSARELQKGKLLIAANEFTALYLLPVLVEFRRVHPMIKIAVQRALGSHIPDDVLRHSAEIGILSYEPQEPSLRSVVVYLDELVFVAPPNHPLASAGQVSIRQLGAESFVAHIVPSPYRDKVIQLFKTHKTPLHMDLELPTLQAIKQFVAIGNGVALLPEICVEAELVRKELVRIPVRELQLKRKLRLIYRKEGNLSHAARAFLKVAEAVAAERKGGYRFQRES